MPTTPPSAVLRRSPGFQHTRESRTPLENVINSQGRGIRRTFQYSCAATQTSDPSSIEQCLQPKETTRRVQLHASLEPVVVPSSVDLRVEDYSNIGLQEPLAQRTETGHRVRSQQVLEKTLAPSSVDVQGDFLPTTHPNDSESALNEAEGPQAVPRIREIVSRRSPISEHGADPRSPNQRENVSPPQMLTTENENGGSPRGATLTEENHGNEAEVRASKADETSSAFAFPAQMNVKQLRSVLKDWRWKQSGNKRTLVARAFLHLQILILSGKTIHEAFSGHVYTRRYDSWISHKVDLDLRSPLYIQRAPRDSELFELLEVREVQQYMREKLRYQRARDGLSPLQPERSDGRGNREVICSSAGIGPLSGNKSPAFSINEFARLCVIVRDYEDAKAALCGTGQELSRSQLDAGFTRDSYWGVIENRFNDENLRLHLNMVGNIDDVDSTLPPPYHRSASFLKEKFLDARKDFTRAVTNWGVSGQNDNADFKRFAGTSNGELSAVGKRNMVLFVCARKGTDNEDTRFSNLSSRAIPFNGGCDEQGAVVSGLSTHARRGSRRNGNDAGDNSDFVMAESWKTMSEAVVADKQMKAEDRRDRAAERKARAEKRKLTEAEEASFKKLQKRQWAVESLAQLEDTVKSKGLQSESFIEVFKRCADMQRESLAGIFSTPQSGEGLACEMPHSDDGAALTEHLAARSGRDTDRERDEDEIQPAC